MRVVDSRIEEIGFREGIATGLRVRLQSDAGAHGLGEAVPLPGYSPDTIDDAVAALDGIHREIAGLHPERGAVAALERALSPAARRLIGSPSARFAVETALLDLVGHALRVPVHRLLSGPPSAAVRAGLLPFPLSPAAIEEARRLVARGITFAKAKVGRTEIEEEIATLAAIRRAAPQLRVRLDANGAWDPETAASALARLAPLGIDWIEEPCARGAWTRLSDPAIPLAVDESLVADGAAEAALASPRVAALVLKPALLGLVRAFRLGRAAHAAGKRAVVSHLFDGPVSLAAAAELALALPAEAHGLDLHAGLAAFPPMPIPQLAPGSAAIEPARAPGLGFDEHDGEGASAWKP